MSFTEKNAHGTANSTTAVDVVAAPASGHVHVVRNVHVHNRDTVAAIVILQLVDSAGPYTRRLTRQSVNADADLTFDKIVVLDSTTKKLQLVLNAAITTTQPDFVTAYGDVA
jgi:hypothetical protein